MSVAPNPTPQDNRSSSDDKLVQLTINTADTSAEVFVIDGDLNLAGRGIGGLNAKFPPGIYKIRIRTAFLNDEKLVVLRKEPVVASFEALPFSTPVPLPNTAKTHEYHEAAAIQESQKIHVQSGNGSSVFVFVREWTPPDVSSPTSVPSQMPQTPSPAVTPVTNPAAGLVLKAQGGAVIADIDKSSSKLDSGSQFGDPWAACTIALNPGPYRLALSTVQGHYEQSIIAPQGWNVHVFVMLRNYEAEGQRERKADLAGAAITLSRQQGFVPEVDESRAVELARLGLAQKRRVLSSQLRHEILPGKFNDPMLGIFGGHLLLLEDPVDVQLLSLVTTNLRAMLGSEHPDVEALALALNEPGKTFEVRVPPMLQRSWQLILDGTATQKAMVMRDGYAAQIMNLTCSGDPWLLWLDPSASSQVQVKEKDVEEVLKEHIFGRKPNLPETPHDSRVAARFGAEALQMLRFATKSLDFSGKDRTGTARNAGATSVEKESQTLATDSISPEKLHDLIRSMGVPRFYIEDLLKKLGVTVSDK